MVTGNYKWVLLATLALLPAYLVRFSIVGIPTTLLEIIIYLAAVGFGWLVYNKKAQWHLPEKKWLFPIGLFVLGAAIGLIISPEKRIAMGQFKALIIDPLLLAGLVYSALKENLIKERDVIFSSIIGGSAVALGAWLLPFHSEGRALSVFGFDPSASPNFLALYLAPAVALLAAGWARLNRYLAAFCGLVLVAGLISSSSRGGALAVALAVTFLAYRTVKKPTRGLAVAAAVIIIMITAFFSRPDLSATPDAGRVATSNNIRYEIWKTTAEMLGKNPRNFVFGVGLGNYQAYFKKFTNNRVNYPEYIAPNALTPHNIFLSLWVNGGLLGLIGFIWLVFLAFRSGSADALPAQAALVAIIGHGLVDTPYFKNDLAALFWIIIVLIMVTSATDDRA